jgi:hypothetical protein
VESAIDARSRHMIGDRNEGEKRGKVPLAAVHAYQDTMTLIHLRLLVLDVRVDTENPIIRAERLALHVRKIVEGVSFAALSAMEHRNNRVLAGQRTMDADNLLDWMNKKGLLRLPSSQRVGASPLEGYAMLCEGAGDQDLSLSDLKEMFSRSSALVHERHPERLTAEVTASETAALENDALRLRSWLWNHIMFLRGEGFLVQMGQFGTPSFLVPLTRVGDLPPSFDHAKIESRLDKSNPPP